MRIYADATTLVALGGIGRLGLLENFDGDPVVLPAVREEVITEPARTNLEEALGTPTLTAVSAPEEGVLDRARSVLDEAGTNGDIQIVAAVLDRRGGDEGGMAVVSGDRRIRTVSDGLGADVTGTIGVIVRAVGEGMPEEEGKGIVRRLDERGLHMTGELRDTANALIEDAAERA